MTKSKLGLAAAIAAALAFGVAACQPAETDTTGEGEQQPAAEQPAPEAPAPEAPTETPPAGETPPPAQ